MCPAPARESKQEPGGGKGGRGGNVEREEGEMAPLEHLFKAFFLDDFSPSLFLQSEFSRLLVSAGPGFSFSVEMRGLLSPHPEPSNSWFSWCSEL